MGNLVTKITTNSVELNESNVSDIVVFEQVIKKDTKEKDNKSPNPSTIQTKAGLFKNVFTGPLDPRSPSTFISRTPIQLFRSVSSSKFNHQELLNESLNESVDLDILTAEEQESLDTNKDLVDAVNKDEAESENDNDKLPDPRSPTTEIVRTPILISDENIKKTEEKLMKKITDKLVAAKISNDNNDGQKKVNENSKKKANKPTEKNLIYEDEFENFDRFSTPPKKVNGQKEKDRTPLSCLANKSRNSQFKDLLTSTPKGSKIPVFETRLHNRVRNKPV